MPKVSNRRSYVFHVHKYTRVANDRNGTEFMNIINGVSKKMIAIIYKTMKGGNQASQIILLHFVKLI